MTPRRLALLFLAVVSVGSLAAGAHGAGSAGRPPGSPDLAAIALAATDLPPGTRIDSQGYHRDPDFVASYEREFDVRGGRIGRTRLLAAFESLDVERTPADAKSTFGLFALLFRGKQGAAFLKAALVEEGIDPSAITVGKIRRPAIGHGSIAIPLRVKASGVRFDLTITFLRFDRVLVALGLVGVPGLKLYATDVDRVSRVAVDRVRAGLVPTNVVPPTWSGTLRPGQPVTATNGRWTGDQLAYEYQWERCFRIGVGCIPIPGATSVTYTVATGDLASALRVSVTARNRLGTASASSGASMEVAGPPGSPLSTVPPRIFGELQVGSTLTAHAGYWSGEPTAFGYQWRRCDPTGACPDIASATASTYVVTSTDSGNALRLFVVATNAAGSGGSISPPSAVIP